MKVLKNEYKIIKKILKFLWNNTVFSTQKLDAQNFLIIARNSEFELEQAAYPILNTATVREIGKTLKQAAFKPNELFTRTAFYNLIFKSAKWFKFTFELKMSFSKDLQVVAW